MIAKGEADSKEAFVLTIAQAGAVRARCLRCIDIVFDVGISSWRDTLIYSFIA